MALSFFVFSIIGGIVSYKLFIDDWNFLGSIFAIATMICVFIAGFSIYSEIKREPKE